MRGDAWCARGYSFDHACRDHSEPPLQTRLPPLPGRQALDDATTTTMSTEPPAHDLREKLRALPHVVGEYLHSIPDDDPLQIALRTYALSLALSLGPALVPFLTSPKSRQDGLTRLGKILRRELGVTGFAFAMTTGVVGGAFLRQLFDVLGEQDSLGHLETKDVSMLDRARRKLAESLGAMTELHRTFLANVLSATAAVTLFHCRRRPVAISTAIPLTPLSSSSSAKPAPSAGRPSITLDLTLLFLVRAMDALAQITIQKGCEVLEENDSVYGKQAAEKRKRLLSMRLDALVFWVSSARFVLSACVPEGTRLKYEQNYVVLLLQARKVARISTRLPFGLTQRSMP